jgi:hypothetical protein
MATHENIRSTISGTPTGTIMPRAYVESVARMAYVWGWPLVNNLNRATAVATLPEPGRLGGVIPVSPPGYISMLTDYIDEAQRFVTCPNQDTVYGAGYQRVDSIPVIIQVPDFGERYFTYQIVDARTDSVCSIGKQFGTRPGHYLLVGPNWRGTPPAGVNAVYRSSTDLCVIFPRVFQEDTPEDKATVQALLRQVMVYPLAELDGTMRSRDWSKTPVFLAPSGSHGETRWVFPDQFFDQLPQVLREIPPLPGEEALYATIQSLLDAAARDPAIAAALRETAIEAERELIAPLFDFHNNGRPVGNGWSSPPNGAHWSVDYLSRAATAKSNMYDNASEETRYLYTDFDSSGERLHGDKAYSVTFGPGRLPPVHGFWSLTLYNDAHFFSPNLIKRYSLGTKNKHMKLDADGSLTLHVQSESPGPHRESNWLPAPEGADFSLYLRAYWPQAAILDGTWQPPAVHALARLH